jgi:hypothetical protein
LPLDNYEKQQQHEWGFRRRKLLDDGRRTKMRKEKETTQRNNHNDSNGTNSNSTSSSLHKQTLPHRGEGGGSRGRSPRPGFEPQTLYKTYSRGPNLSPRRSLNAKKLVNWRLACFMSNEYLTRGTLLGRPWPPQDSNNSKNPDREADESRREKERLYYTLTDFLRAGDVHLPEIVNPSQMAAWLGLN